MQSLLSYGTCAANIALHRPSYPLALHVASFGTSPYPSYSEDHFQKWRLGLRLNERWLSDHPGILKHLSERLEGLATNSGLALSVRELSFDAFPDPSCKFPDKVVLDAGDIVKGFLLDYRALLLDFVKYLPRFNLVETISLSDLKINHEI
ncbi:hypothetical protein CPB84DRAFT_767039 [Gymnopilus junonius]|uniref:Uncharacterized protein n=1 Tax=Gymnopilus junonius TaxID=109634 RepID=A0A9P5NXZ6_GYMJU|nr:hypothetical protein CPB84DRAFT_767039 [Gymnopilus junonius]